MLGAIAVAAAVAACAFGNGVHVHLQRESTCNCVGRCVSHLGRDEVYLQMCGEGCVHQGRDEVLAPGPVLASAEGTAL